VLTFDEARRIAVNVAKLTELLAKALRSRRCVGTRSFIYDPSLYALGVCSHANPWLRC